MTSVGAIIKYNLCFPAGAYSWPVCTFLTALLCLGGFSAGVNISAFWENTLGIPRKNGIIGGMGVKE